MPRLHLPACLAPPARDFRLLGLLGIVVRASSGLWASDGREAREGRGKAVQCMLNGTYCRNTDLLLVVVVTRES